MKTHDTDKTLLTTKTEYPTKLFVSYTHAENEIVRKIKDRLKARGHDVWFDEGKIHHDDDWREKIVSCIETGNGVLSFLSTETEKRRGRLSG